MKLDRKTRNLVQIGTVLSTENISAVVTNMWRSGRYNNGLSVSLMIQTGELAGRMLYGEPLSHYYGWQMENTADYDRLVKLAERLDKALKDAEPYDYEGSTEQALERLEDDPIGIVEYLVGIVEEI